MTTRMEPVKSIPRTPNGVHLCVRDLDSLVADSGRNHLQPRQSLLTRLNNYRNLGTQYFSLTFLMVELTPPWSVWMSACSMILRINEWFFGKNVGYSPSILPRHSRTSLWLGCSLRWNITFSISSMLALSCWVRLIHHRL